MSSITLHYFPVRARTEAIHLILAYGGVQFDNVTVTFAEWAELKLKCPFSQLPILDLPAGSPAPRIAESGAIVRYVAKLAKVFPEDAASCAQADMVFELAQALAPINPIFNMTPYESEDWKAAYAKYFASFPSSMASATAILGDKNFFGNDAPHFGDFGLFHVCDLALCVEPTCLDAFPAIAAWMVRTKAIPSVASYLEKRPNSSTPGFGIPGSMLVAKGM
jgi:glutathione S-transferase